MMRTTVSGWTVAIALMLAVLCAVPLLAHAQTAAENQLRATILAGVMSDPRSKEMTPAQIYSLVNSLMLQAQANGLTASALEYRPQVPASQGAGTGNTLTNCSDISCALASSFGLDGSVPIIPIALFITAALFILIYGLMREMGHPHTQLPKSSANTTA